MEKPLSLLCYFRLLLTTFVPNQFFPSRPVSIVKIGRSVTKTKTRPSSQKPLRVLASSSPPHIATPSSSELDLQIRVSITTVYARKFPPHFSLCLHPHLCKVIHLWKQLAIQDAVLMRFMPAVCHV